MIRQIVVQGLAGSTSRSITPRIRSRGWGGGGGARLGTKCQNDVNLGINGAIEICPFRY